MIQPVIDLHNLRAAIQLLAENQLPTVGLYFGLNESKLNTARVFKESVALTMFNT